MAAFSHQHYPFLLDSSVLLPNSPIKTSGFLEEPNNINNPCFPHFYQPETLQEITGNVSVHESGSCLDQSTQKVTVSNNNEPSVTNKTSTDSSSITDKVESGEQVSQKVAPMDKKRKIKQGSSINSAQSKNIRAVKGKKQKKSNDIMKTGEEKRAGEDKKDDKNASEEAPTGYIHVRARRGQATDSHSLAERVRRERISERMKILQALVPGCDKVTGKALMLDEIINYVQSLQHQVEFLSMKLASVNPMFYDFGVDLDTFMVRNDQRLNALASPPPPPPPSMQPCNPTQSSVTSDPNNSLATANNYSTLDSSPSLLFQQGYMPNTVPQVNGQLWWDMDDQRQILINQSVFSNNLCSFH